MLSRWLIFVFPRSRALFGGRGDAEAVGHVRKDTERATRPRHGAGVAFWWARRREHDERRREEPGAFVVVEWSRRFLGRFRRWR